jgi:undecaprenyl-diphosphatase
MAILKFETTANIFSQFDLAICRYFNKLSSRRSIELFFSVISNLGNGKAWYTLILVIPVFYGKQALFISGKMILAGILGLIFYKIVKSTTERLRPYMVDKQIRLGTPPMDKYSFPSGHTLHATSFSIIVLYYLPQLYFFVLPFALLVAASRIILGLHYPTDVLAGAIFGTCFAVMVILL